MAVSLRPRHPADIREERAERLKKRPSLTLRRGPNLMLTALPAILTAVAVYAGLVYFDKIAQRLAAEWAGDPATAQAVRDVQGVVKPPPVLDQTPPPSPERVVEEQARALSRDDNPTASPALPVLLPELEPSPLPANRVKLSEMGIQAPVKLDPLVTVPAAATTTDGS